MNAVIVYLAFDPTDLAAAADAFATTFAAKAKAMPGFVSGHWIEPIDKRGMGFLVFDTEPQAIAAAKSEHWATPGVRVVHVQVAQIAASA